MDELCENFERNNQMNRKKNILTIIFFVFSFVLGAEESLQIIKGPYLQNLTQTSIVVMWETNIQATSLVEYGGNNTSNKKQKNELVTIHEITLSNLVPGKTYNYRVSSKKHDYEIKSQEYSFRTAPSEPEPWQFAVYADCQGNPNIHRTIVDLIMNKGQLAFAIRTGDQVMNGSDYEQWDSLYFEPAKHFLPNNCVWLCLGNHENNADWYFKFFSLPNNERWYSFNYLNADFFVLDSYFSDFSPESEQYKWLINELEKSKAVWKVVIMHTPAFSSGVHGHTDDNGIPVEEEVKNTRTWLDPVFQKYEVDIVFSGHEHFYERSKKNNVYYIVAGNAGSGMYSSTTVPWSGALLKKESNPYSQVLHRTYSYVMCHINGDTFNLEARDTTDSIIDSLEIAKKLKVMEPQEKSIRSQEKLVGYWPLDDGQGSTVADKSGNENNGAIQKADWIKNETGTVLDFNGIDSVVVIPHNDELHLEDELTIELWVCPKTPLEQNPFFFEKGGSNYMSGYQFISENGKLAFIARTEKFGGMAKNFKWFTLSTDEPVLTADTWSHIAVTYSLKNDKTRLYLNGKILKESAAGGKILYLEGYEKNKAGISGSGYVPTYPYGRLRGFIREVKVYRQALSAEDIKSQYEQTRDTITNLRNFKTKEDIAKEKLTAKINAKITDSATGEETEAKVFLRGADGKYYAPENAFVYGNEKLSFFDAFGNFTINVPPGKATLLIGKGYEYIPREISINVQDNQHTTLEISLDRLIDMPSRGWYCGEDELQYCNAHGEGGFKDYFRKLAGGPMPDGFINACKICKSDGLNWIQFVSAEPAGWDNKYYSLMDSKTFTARHGVELRGIYGGDIICVGVNQKQITGKNQYEQLENILSIGGAANLADGGLDIGNAKAYLMGRWMPVLASLNKVNLFHHAFLPFNSEWIKISYRLLNCGVKIAQAAGTDFYMIFSHSANMKPGHPRSYLKLSELTWPAIVDAYKKQRLFITNGPLIFFTINNRDMGETISLAGKNNEIVICSLETYSINRIDKAEIIKNGEVIKTITANDGKIKESFELPIEDTCWVAARVYGKTGTFAGGQAHTAPIYIQFGKEPMKPKNEDIEYFLKWISTIRNITPDFNKNFGQDHNWVYPLLDESQKIFESLKNNPKKWK